MKGRLASVLFMVGAALAWAQVPPNDEFTNRTVLAGSSFTITADTKGATFDELNEPPFPYDATPQGANPLNYVPSVWWSWTPTQSSAVVIENVDGYTPTAACLKVYNTTNISYDSWRDQISGIHMEYHGQYAVFSVQAGVQYQISVCSQTVSPLRFRLTATNVPVFRLHPQSRTISPGQSALFTASAVGLGSLRYQWRKDGVDILNATNQMLALDNCSVNDAAAYSVAVANPTGVSTSAVAQLFVATNSFQPALLASAANVGGDFHFSVAGEIGRLYRVDYSEDLHAWQSPWTSVILNTNEMSCFAVPRDSKAKFVRLRLYRPPSEGCNNRFRQFRFAIWQWAEANRKTDRAAVWPEILQPYLIDGLIPRCPDSDGIYFVVDVVNRPSCESAPYLGHFFEEP